MISWWVNIFVYYLLFWTNAQRPVHFVAFLENLSDQTYFFNEPSFYIYYFLLVVSLSSKVYIFPSVLNIYYFTRYTSTHLYIYASFRYKRKAKKRPCTWLKFVQIESIFFRINCGICGRRYWKYLQSFC